MGPGRVNIERIRYTLKTNNPRWHGGFFMVEIVDLLSVLPIVGSKKRCNLCVLII